MLVCGKHFLYNIFLGFLTMVKTDTAKVLRNINDVDAPSYYKYDAKPGQFPWIVSFKTVEHCIGTLVDPSWVLTAAHCLEQSSDPSYYTLELGYVSTKNVHSNQQVETASELHPYLRYHNSKTVRVRDYGNDIALVKLRNPFKGAPTLQMTLTPHMSDKHHMRPCHIFGFVKELSNPRKDYKVLQFARVYGHAFDNCYHKSLEQQNVKFMMRHTLCATGVNQHVNNACSGDPGGPLVCPVEEVKWKDSSEVEVVGVSSWNEPGVYCGATSRYTDVGYFRDWLQATIHRDTFVVPRKREYEWQEDSNDTFPCSGTTVGLKHDTTFFLVAFYTGSILYSLFSQTTNLINSYLNRL